MPGAVVHSQACMELLRTWPSIEVSPIADLDFLAAAENQQAFLSGALAPDIGYFGDLTILADLAHYHQTADLLRRMLHRASKPVDHAFVLGWLSHVLVDVVLHTAINRAAGRARGTLDPLSYADDPALHIRIELGLDIWAASHPPAFERALIKATDPICSASQLALIAHAVQAQYGVELQANSLSRCNVTATRRLKRLSRFIGAQASPSAAAQQSDPIGPLARLGLRLLFKAIGLATHGHKRSLAYAATHPLPPDADLLREFAAALPVLDRLFHSARETQIDALLNYNLDLGIPSFEPASQRYAPAASLNGKIGRPIGKS